MRSCPALGKGQLRGAFCSACVKGTGGERKEKAQALAFLFFIFRLFNLRGWRWAFSLVG